MAGVWVFENGVYRLVKNPQAEGLDGSQASSRRKVLVHLPSGEEISSYSSLEQILRELGWERYHERGNANLIRFHRHNSIDLISLPRDFSKFSSYHMFDIVVKNPNIFHVQERS